MTRGEALQLYTSANGWFVKEEDKLDSDEEGKLGDIVVPSDDSFSVSEDALKKLGPILTIVDGQISCDARVLQVQDR